MSCLYGCAAASVLFWASGILTAGLVLFIAIRRLLRFDVRRGRRPAVK